MKGNIKRILAFVFAMVLLVTSTTSIMPTNVSAEDTVEDIVLTNMIYNYEQYNTSGTVKYVNRTMSISGATSAHKYMIIRYTGTISRARTTFTDAEGKTHGATKWFDPSKNQSVGVLVNHNKVYTSETGAVLILDLEASGIEVENAVKVALSSDKQALQITDCRWPATYPTDDVILEKDRIKLKYLKETLTKDTDIVMLKYDLNVDTNGSPALSYYRERLLKRKNNYKWKSPIHEVIELKGNILKEDISITHKKEKTHDSKRNLKIFNKMMENNIEFDSRQRFYYARELYYNEEYENAIKHFEIFLNDKNGWIENKISACLDLYYLYLKLNDEDNALDSLFRSFRFDIPRAEICCNIANYFVSKNNYNTAIYWYKEASTRIFDVSKGGFYIKDCYDFLPYIGLCVCYDKLGEHEIANYYNDLAGKIKPNDKSYINNFKYFKSIGMHN